MLPVLAGIAIGSSILGGVLQGLGAKQQADAAREAALENARLARLAAADAVRRGEQQAGLVRRDASRVIGQQRVAYAASGVDVGVGSPVNVAGDTRMIAEMDAEVIRNNAAREAWGYRRQGAQFSQQASAANAAGQYAIASTVLGTVGNVAGMAYTYGAR